MNVFYNIITIFVYTLKQNTMKIQISRYAKEYSSINKKTGLIFENENSKIYTVNLLFFRMFSVVTISK